MKARETGRKRFKFPELDMYGLLTWIFGVVCGICLGLLISILIRT